MKTGTAKERELGRRRRGQAAIDKLAQERGMVKQAMTARVMLWFEGLPRPAQSVVLGQVTRAGELAILGKLLNAARGAQGLEPDADLADVERHCEAMLAELVALDGMEESRTGWRLRDFLTDPQGG